MAVRLRLKRRGRKKLALYDLIVADARSPRDGRYIEKLGTYNPGTDPATIDIDDDKALDWLLKGVEPTDTARRILSYRGVMLRKHLQIGVNKGALTQEEADKKFEAWKKEKESQIEGKKDSLAKTRDEAAQARLEQEKKVNEARAEVLKKKKDAAIAALAGEIAEAKEETSEDLEELVEAVEESEVIADTDAPAKAEEVKAETVKEDKPEEPAKKDPVAEKSASEAPVEKAKSEEAPKQEEEVKSNEAPKQEEEVKTEVVAEAKEEKKEEVVAEAAPQAVEAEKKEEVIAEAAPEEKEEVTEPAQPEAKKADEAPAEDKKEDKKE